MTVRTSVTFSGGFFRRDPGATLTANIQRIMAAVAAEAAANVQQRLRAGQSGREPISLLGNRVAEHVVGRVKSLSGKPWLATAVISVNNSGYGRAEGISLMAAASEVESRTRAFRSTYLELRRSRAVLAANLTEGIE